MRTTPCTGKTTLSATTSYVYGLSGELLVETTAGNDTDYVYLDGTPLAQVRSNQVYYIHTDPLGLPSAITDARQTLVWYWDADPYGTSSPSVGLNGTDVNFTFNLRFPGQYFDQESGLHYNYFRYYDPQTGRYITSDPIGLKGGLNIYGYVGGNPINYFDLFGLDPAIGPYSPGAFPPDPYPNQDARTTPVPPGQNSMYPPGMPIGPWVPSYIMDAIISGCKPYYSVGGGLAPFVGSDEIYLGNCRTEVVCKYSGKIFNKQDWSVHIGSYTTYTASYSYIKQSDGCCE